MSYIAAAAATLSVFLFAGSVDPVTPEPEEPQECGGHAHLHSNPDHKRWVRKLYRNPWLSKKARAKHRHKLRCAEKGDAKPMRKRWKVVKHPVRGVAISTWTTWVRVGRCEQPGPGRWGVWWSHKGGTYSGGLGFYNASWSAFKLRGYPANAGDASWRQQMRTAENLWRSVGWGWGCSG